MKKRKKNRKNRWKSLRFLSMHASKSKQIYSLLNIPVGLDQKLTRELYFFQVLLGKNYELLKISNSLPIYFLSEILF